VSPELVELKAYNKSSLVANAVTCTRGERELFVNLNFKITSGDILQIQGPNGCGKTSLLRIVIGLVQAESGEILWNEESIHKSETYLDELQYIGHQSGVKSTLSALENLEFARNLKGDNSQDFFDVLDSLGLRGFEDLPCNNLSAGQKRRVGLARLFVSNCQLWVLDEPFTALDAKGIAKLEQEFLHHLNNNGLIILTTHQPLQSLQTHLQIINPLDFCHE